MKNYNHILLYGFYTFLGLGSYFMFMDILGYSDQVVLRYFNGLIMMLGVNQAIKMNVRFNRVSYLHNFFTGLSVGFVSIILSVVSLSILLNVRDQSYTELLGVNLLQYSGVRIVHICTLIFVEGFASSVFFAFLSMQYWKSKSYVNLVV